MSEVENLDKLEWQHKYELLANQTFEYIQREITKVCDANNWDFTSLNGGITGFVERGTDNEVNTDFTDKFISEFIFWYDELYHLPDCMYVERKWSF